MINAFCASIKSDFRDETANRCEQAEINNEIKIDDTMNSHLAVGLIGENILMKSAKLKYQKRNFIWRSLFGIALLFVKCRSNLEVTITANEQGFVQAGHCYLSSAELKHNKEIKLQVNN
jgi:hypothetical protein